MMVIVSEYHSGPVTALCCHGNKIIAGIGSRLHVYSVSPVKYEQVCVVLAGRNIHGILAETNASDARLCVYGEKSLRLILYNHNTTQIQFLSDQYEFADWIWDVTWLQETEQLCVALAHNSVVTWDIATSRVVGRSQCSEGCILYTAKFLTDTWSELVVAAGTVFNQVVIWSPDCVGDQDDSRVPLHRLTGHQGVIFSIDYNPASQRICSASDDRSIRLYQLQFPRGFPGPGRGWAGVTSSLVHVLYGHSARVWAVRLLTAGLVSVGEDAACCLWSYDGQVLQKYKGHKGKSIWSIAVDPTERCVVTGGGDYSIRLWHLQLPGNTTATVTTRVLPQLCHESDFPRSTQLLDYNRVLVMTNAGQLILYDLDTRNSTFMMEDTKFESYTVMSISPSRKWIAVGNIHGTLRLISTEISSDCDNMHFNVDTCVYNGKVHSIHWLDDTAVLTTGPAGDVTMWRLEANVDAAVHMTMAVGGVHVTKVGGCELPESKQRWVAAVALSLDGEHIVCGDRVGSVLVYRTGQQNGELVQKFHKLHGKAGVTHVCWYGNQVYTTGRDGQYRLYDWVDGQLVLLNSNRVCKGFEWLERLSFTDDGDILIQGFHTNQFVLWSVRENRKLLEVECGGGHRAWDFISHRNHGDGSANHGDKSRLVYLKAREVIVKTAEMSSHQTIVKSSLHGRELCDVKHIWTGGGATMPVQDLVSRREVHVIATCSEDTTVCLSALVSDERGWLDLRPLHTLTGHISSVRCLAVCGSRSSHDATFSRKLLFSAGGRAQMKVWSVTVHVLDETNNLQQDANTRSTQIDKYIQNCSASNENENVNKQTVTELYGNASGSNICDLGRTDTSARPGNRHDTTNTISSSSGACKPGSLESTITSEQPGNTHDTTNTISSSSGACKPGSLESTITSEQPGNTHDTTNTISSSSGACKPGSLESTITSEQVGNQHNDNSVDTSSSVTATVAELDKTEYKPVFTQPPSVCDGRSGEAQYSSRTIHDNVRDSAPTFHCTYESLGGIELGHSTRRRSKSWRTKCDNSDPETRILDITAFHGQELNEAMPESLYFIATACSDGHVRFLTFEEDTREVTLIISSDYHNHCVLKVCHMFHVSEQTTHVLVATAATDGRVAFWDITSMCHRVAITTQHKHADCNDWQYPEYVINSLSDLQMNGTKQAVESTENIQMPNAESGDGETNCNPTEVNLPNIDGDLEHIAQRNTDDVCVTEADDKLKDDQKGSKDRTPDNDKLTDDVCITEANAACSKGDQKSSEDRTDDLVLNDKLTIQPIFVLTLHQSGINSLHIKQQTDGKYLLVTGGDDNAVHVTKVTIDVGETLAMKVTATGGHPSAHAAQVTGVWCVAEDRIVTASIDQRVCVWELPEDGSGVELRLVGCKFVSVPDIANIDVFSNQGRLYLLLCGEGLELLHIDSRVL